LSDTQTNAGPAMKSYVAIWIGLLCIVGVEVFLTYRHFSTEALLFWLLLFAFVEAAIAVLYFMHMKYERPSVFWTMIPVLLFVLFMMDHFWPDAMRLENLRVIRW
jgi:cytochrome c oxidase subunit IV